MTPSISWTNLEHQAGWLALTDAETEQPFLVRVDEIEKVEFEFSSPWPNSVIVQYRRDGKLFAPMIYEYIEELLEMMKKAADELSPAPKAGER